MNSIEIFRALQKGAISPEDAKRELINLTKSEVVTEFASSRSSENQGFPSQSINRLNNHEGDNQGEFAGESSIQSVVNLHEVQPGIVQLTMQDRANKNTFSQELVESLKKSFELIQSNSRYKVVILTGCDSYFASGETQEASLAVYESKKKFTDLNIYSIALECKIPVIAAMQGHGIGTGWCMGMFCDFIVMSRESYYTTNFMKFGFTPGAGATLIFSEKFGISLAQEILFTGNRFSGSELESRGIPFPVLPGKEVLPYAIQLARTLSELPREFLIALKDLMVDPVKERLSFVVKREIEMKDRTFINPPQIKERIQSSFTPLPIKDNYKFLKSTKQVVDIPVEQNSQNAIAIIGMSGQFPNSKNLDEFWDNVACGVDCIAEIPNSRWPIELYYDPNPKVPGKTYSKWMGVCDDVDKFDPLFFNISPAEAELMDPQQRLFLESCWSCIENAGMSPSLLSGSNCGVFVGCGTSDYGQLLQEQGLNAKGLMGQASSILSARISYLLDLKGPCLAIDTACSSSLVAIAEACNSLILHTSDLALAGGVHVTVGPFIHIMGSKGGMLSKDGRCFTFDNRANGFVIGEGVGVVLLKRLSDAIHDQDTIYGVIRGWGVNQDGKTNGMTAPSVNSQIVLEKQVYERFGIDPATITMIEAHGTGTKLGDPIEVEALIKSFQSHTDKKNYCALGSVKSNIGHLLSAAGVAGVIKVLFALQHRMLPPTINFENLNRHISLDDTPFFVNTKLRSWEVDSGTPRCAGVSAFGFSGTNAHIVIEEYLPQNETVRVAVPVSENNPGLFILSAKSEERLKFYAESIRNWVEIHEDVNLADVAYTLQVGREAMDYRLAFLADGRQVLLKALEGFIANNLSPDILTSQLEVNKDRYPTSIVHKDATLLQTFIQERKLQKLAELWVKGLTVDWNMLYDEIRPNRIGLPTYPFARERYWIPEFDSSTFCTTSPAVVTAIHPLLHQNTSNISGLQFSSTFNGREFFLADHVIKGQRVLPGVCCLEMARVAVNQVTGTLREGHFGIRMKNVVWVRPIVSGDQPLPLDIRLFPKDNGEIDYEIFSQPHGTNSEPLLYSQGSATLGSLTKAPVLDIPTLQAQCCKRSFSSDQYYNTLRMLGIEYSQDYQWIKGVYLGRNQVLVKLSLPSTVCYSKTQFLLHPRVMDSALQASVVLKIKSDDVSDNLSHIKTAQVYALQELEIFDSCNCFIWARIRYSNGSNGDNIQKLDIDLCDESGTICVTMKGLLLTADWNGTFTVFPKKLTSNIKNIQNRIPQHNSQLLPVKSETVERMKNMDRLLCKLLWAQLQSVGLFMEKKSTIAELKTKIGLSDLYGRWLEESIAVLMRNNYLKYDGNICIVNDIQPVDIDNEWKEWDREKVAWLEDSNMKAQIALVEATLGALPEILTGSAPATDIMFPNSSMALVEGIYKNNLVADYFNEQLGDIVVAYVQERIKQDSSARIRIIEIGAGTGGTSARVFQKITPYRDHIQEYCYTDISKAFLIHAEEEYGSQNPYLTYKIFDVEAPVAEQEISAGGFDIAIAANVLHATRNICQTLHNIKAIIENNGLIILNEMSSNFLFTHLTFGLLEGWWLYQDADLRIPGCPGLYPETWQKVLESEGFRSVFFPAQEVHYLGQQIIVAESDGIVRNIQEYMQMETPAKKRHSTQRLIKQSPKPQIASTQTGEVVQEVLQEKSTEYFKKFIGEILKIPGDKIDPKRQLSEYGMDSITGIKLTEKLREMGIELDARQFFSEFTLQEIIKQIGSIEPLQHSFSDPENKFLLSWEADKELSEELFRNMEAVPFRHSSSPGKVFLTGVTGLVGAFLAAEILENSPAVLYCFVRAESESVGLKRIQDNFKKHGLWKRNYLSRIKPVLGDLTKPQLGIENSVYVELSQTVETIYHCAAVANHVLNYLSLKGPNVNGTLSIMEFAGNIKVKPIHFISSSLVCSKGTNDSLFSTHRSETAVDNGKHLISGYIQTKWVSEHHLLQVQERGIPITIFRCGQVTGSSRTGRGIAEDMFHSMLKIFSEVEVVPRWAEQTMDILPIDYVCRSIFTVTRQNDCYGKIYHMTHPNPIPVQRFFEFLRRKNPSLPEVSFDKWVECCLEFINNQPETPIRTVLVEFFKKNDSGDRLFEYYFRNLNLKHNNIQKVLQNTGITIPKMDEKWWKKCFNRIALLA